MRSQVLSTFVAAGMIVFSFVSASAAKAAAPSVSFLLIDSSRDLTHAEVHSVLWNPGTKHVMTNALGMYRTPLSFQFHWSNGTLYTIDLVNKAVSRPSLSAKTIYPPLNMPYAVVSSASGTSLLYSGVQSLHEVTFSPLGRIVKREDVAGLPKSAWGGIQPMGFVNDKDTQALVQYFAPIAKGSTTVHCQFALVDLVSREWRDVATPPNADCNFNTPQATNSGGILYIGGSGPNALMYYNTVKHAVRTLPLGTELFTKSKYTVTDPLGASSWPVIGSQGGIMLISYGMGDSQLDTWAVRKGTIIGELVLTTRQNGDISVSAGGNTIYIPGASGVSFIVWPNSNEGI